jgi:hypothetical protein
MLRSKDMVRNAAIIKLPTCLKCGSIGIDMAKDFAKWWDCIGVPQWAELRFFCNGRGPCNQLVNVTNN